MIKLGLTGGIGSGKSHASHILRECGAYIIDCDVLAREVTMPHAKGASLLKNAFGDSIFTQGVLDRKKLSDIVFFNPYKYALLNTLILPLIISEARLRLKYAYGEKIAVVVAPILFEADMRSLFDTVWTISCEEKTRINRVLNRNNIDEKTIKAILGFQLTDEERNKKAHLVIDNNGTLEEFSHKIRQEYANLLASCDDLKK